MTRPIATPSFIAAAREYAAAAATIPLRHCEPFALTDAQFAALAVMPKRQRDLNLGILAHAHEYEQHRRDLKNGRPWLMNPFEQAAFMERWPRIAAAKTAEAVAAFERRAQEAQVAA